MTPNPHISVLLPVRNAAATLDEALQSLSSQTFRDFEIVAVDDGSSDGTGALLEEWSLRDKRIKFVTSSPRGIVDALNTAAQRARAELLARMDADDVAAPDRFELQVDFMNDNPDIAACGTCVRYVPPEAVRDGARRYEEWINSVITSNDIERDLFVECPIPHPSLMIRRVAFESAGGYRNVGWPEDYDLILRLWQGGCRFGKVDQVGVYWRERPDRLSRIDARYSQAAFRRCKAHFIRDRLGGRQVAICGAGPVGKSFALALQELGCEIAAFVDFDPRKIGQMIHGAPVIHPSRVETLRGCYAVAAVGSADARQSIRAMLHDAGWTEPDDCCAVA